MGAELVNGKKLMFIHDECAETEELLEASFGDVQSNRNRFGPGER